jgi:intracellular sulfur oxidation DsrE/DsrF family protein
MSSKPESGLVLLVTNDGMGRADQELQHRLMGTYLQLLDENNQLPEVICFYTEGVKLVVHGSPVIDQLQSLQEKGVLLVICNTCLKYYNLVDQVAVGIVGGMTDIIEAQWRANKVITL